MEGLAVAEIDVNALAHNTKQLKRIAAGSRLMAVVKADGYGHGAVPISQTALSNGADCLAVARLSEALNLRAAGIEAPILLFGYSSPETVELLVHHRITGVANDIQSARALSEAALRIGSRVKVHLKVDTGMGRLGTVVVPGKGDLDEPPGQIIRSAADAIVTMAALPGLEVEGIFTHFANADSADKRHARNQFSIFMDLLEELKKHSMEVEIRHAANSAATIEMPETHLDMVRPGIALYGLWPSNETDRSLIDLKPVMTLRSKVIGVKMVPADFSVSYGSTYITTRPTTIATIALGYADGLNRLLSSVGSLLINGQRCPILGRVCMDLVMADVTHVPNVSLEDDAIAIGQQGKEQITAEEIADLVGTINYEVVTSITPRVQRVYQQ
jgi:alanine racemase